MMVKSFFSGAILVASLAIALFFYRFRKSTGDRLFGYFAMAFVLLGTERVSAEFLPDEYHWSVYLIRLVAFLLILFAIWDKNWKEKGN